jgi:hypothetical protein
MFAVKSLCLQISHSANLAEAHGLPKREYGLRLCAGIARGWFVKPKLQPMRHTCFDTVLSSLLQKPASTHPKAFRSFGTPDRRWFLFLRTSRRGSDITVTHNLIQ